MKLLILSCSLNSDSRSRVLAERAYSFATKNISDEFDVQFVDLQKVPLPLCDGQSAYGDANAIEIKSKIQEADAVLMAVPIYNYDVNAAAKNVIELSGKAWLNKTVGFLCAAGGQGSYMSVMSLANSLMLDFRCIIVPRFVYATGAAFQNDELDTEVERRVDELVAETIRISSQLKVTESV